MVPLIIIAISLILFGGFIGLTSYETRTGTRFFAAKRTELDRFAERMFFLATHIDFAAFARHTAHQVGEYVAHEVAHLSLITIRAAERLLTRVVKALRARRMRREALKPSVPASSFVHSMTAFKKRLPKHQSAEPLQTDAPSS